MFINTLPLRIEIDASNVAESVRMVQQRLAGLLRHEHAPLSLAQRCSGVPAPAPLFTSLLNYRHGVQAEDTAEAMAWEGIQTLSSHERTNYPLAVSIDDVGSGFTVNVQSQHPLVPGRIGAFLMQALTGLVDALVHAPEKRVRDLDVLPEAERHQVLTQWNATAVDYPRDAYVHELFEAQVARTPSAIALVQGQVSLTYGELNTQANRMAHYLRELGVRPDDRVAICAQRSVEMVVALLAVLKAGSAYVPLDPAYPPERLAYMRADCGALTVLTDTASRHLVEDSVASAVIVDLQADSKCWEHLPDSNPDRHASGLTARHLAYVIYTSGSTGAPKGAMNEHRSVVNLALAQIRAFNVEENSRVMQFSSLSFDAFASELFVSLLCGASLYIADRDAVLAGETLTKILNEHQISHVTLPPSVLNNLPEKPAFSCLKTLVVAGEALSASIVERWGQGRRLINAYGPTETTVCACLHECDASMTGAPPIGRPIANVRIYILDAHIAPVPIGVAGELYIGGDGVARGYLNRDDLTVERFLPDPFSADPTARMYRTGDLGRWRADGTIEFVGRNDHQVKIRGFRIELGEIEARLSAHAEVRECVVVALDAVTSSDKRLVAYWVGAEGVISEHLGAETLRSWLTDVLPDYMVPAAYVRLDRLPLTPNGKLDRKALPAPDGSAYAAHAYEAPQGEIEQTIAAIWSELLGLENIGRHDNFFALGGHSLLGVRLISRI
ncbi:non-ribosomal peptide synthetase, partial [Xanthomonas albilineans]|uniref:non-ribosomal peptide synthetase n=1 Tax=Xanthomonas albilineans TaxID=29447 RepID=UPI0012D3CEC7